MKFGLREKIFACGLIAVSLVFLLYDSIYLNPKKNHAIEEIQLELKKENSKYTEIAAGAAQAKVLNEYDEAKTKLMTFSLIGIVVSFGYAWILAGRMSQGKGQKSYSTDK